MTSFFISTLRFKSVLIHIDGLLANASGGRTLPYENSYTVIVKVAHVRLCHSRMLFVWAYPSGRRFVDLRRIFSAFFRSWDSGCSP